MRSTVSEKHTSVDLAEGIQSLVDRQQKERDDLAEVLRQKHDAELRQFAADVSAAKDTRIAGMIDMAVQVALEEADGGVNPNTLNRVSPLTAHVRRLTDARTAQDLPRLLDKARENAKSGTVPVVILAESGGGVTADQIKVGRTVAVVDISGIVPDNWRGNTEGHRPR